jgi:hypothetical protein
MPLLFVTIPESCGATKELSGQMPPDCGNHEHHEGVFMKIDRHGKAKILSQEEIQLLFNEGLTTLRDRCLFGICSVHRLPH